MSEYTDAIDLVWDDYGSVQAYRSFAISDLDGAQSELDGGDQAGAIQELIDAGRDICDSLNYVAYWEVFPYPRYPIIYVFEALKNMIEAIEPADPYELDMTKLIAAYIDAPDDLRSAWQLLTDAFQASMYDKPFDLGYHVDWVRRFQSWR